MALLSKDQILTADDLVTEDVECPEWGGTVRLRALTGTERDAYEASCIAEKGGKRTANLENVRAKLVARSIVDDKGERLFSDADVKKLGMKSASVLNRLWDASRKLSGLTEEDVEELAEGFGDAQSEASTSD